MELAPCYSMLTLYILNIYCLNYRCFETSRTWKKQTGRLNLFFVGLSSIRPPTISSFPYLQFSLFIFWTGEDMVSYERPIWEFVFDRVADLDKKSILLVMYSDLFTARSPRCLPPPAKVFGSQLGSGGFLLEGSLSYFLERKNQMEILLEEPSFSRWKLIVCRWF